MVSQKAVTPAEAGLQKRLFYWIPAFAGMTKKLFGLFAKVSKCLPYP
jgi:hypothetical protein